MIEVGTKPSIYNEPFEDIAIELVGKEGKRNVRTVIFRSFIYSFQKQRSSIQSNIFLDWSKDKSLEELTLLFFWKILMDYEVARFIIKKIDICVDSSNSLSVALLSKKLVQEYGDRDVVKRSLRSFLATLDHFGFLSQIDKKNYNLFDKAILSNGQLRDFLILYARAFLRSKVVDIKNIEPEFFFFFQPVDLPDVAKEYNGIDWQYIRGTNRNQLILRNEIN
jgi:hypothetical protein